MADKQLKISLVGDSSSLDKALSKAQKDLVQFSDKMKSIGQSLSIGLTAPLVAAGAASIKFASDFNESLNKVEVAFKSSSGAVKDFAKTSLKSFGIAEGSALDMAALFGDMATSMGISTSQAAKLSTSMVGLAGDLASFKNMNIGEVTTALNGVFTGETESLKRLGIVMTEVNLQNYAISKGIKTKLDAMSQAEKVMLRYQYVMSVTSNAQGDFARTGGGAANQMRLFQEQLKQIGNTFGQVVLPTFTQIVTKVNGILSSFEGLGAGTKEIVVILGSLAALAGPLLYIAGSVIPKVIAGFNMLTKVIGTTNLALAGKGGLIALLALAGYELYNYARQTDNYNRKNGISATVDNDTKSIAKKIVSLKEEIKLLEEQSDKLSDVEKRSAKASIFTKKTQLNNLRNQYATLTQPTATPKVGGGATIPTTKTKSKTNDFLEEEIRKAQELYDTFSAGQKKFLEEQDRFNSEQVGRNLSSQEEQLGNLNSWYDEQLNLAKHYGIDSISIDDEYKRRLANLNKSFQDQDLADLQTYGQDAQAILDADNARKVESTAKAWMQLQEQTKIIADSIGNAFASMGTSLVDSFGLAKTGFEGFLSAMASGLVQLAAMYVKQLIMSQASATGKAVDAAAGSAAATGPAGVFTLPAFIALAVGAIGSAFSGMPKFAAGGIVSGPTMGLMGEYPGAKSNPEVIAPLSKLQGMLDGGNGGNNLNLSGEFVVRGQDLILALQRADKIYNRLG